MSRKEIITRQEQRTEDTWNMQDLFVSEEQFVKEKEQLEQMMQTFASYEGTLEQGADQMLRVLQLYEKMNLTFERLYVYANQRWHEDTANAVYQKLSGEMQILSARLGQVSAWLEPEILAMEPERLEAYLNVDGPDAAVDLLRSEENPNVKWIGNMAGYRRMINQITRKRVHILDAQTEALLTRVDELAQAPSNIFSMFNNADIRFPDVADAEGNMHPLTQGTYLTYLQSKDRTLRRNAFEALYAVYEQFGNTLAASYYANLKQADFFAKERHYKNALEEALDASAIPVSVYDNLIEAVHEALPLMHRYVKLRKKMLQVPELHMYDNYVPLVEQPEERYSFEEAKKLALEGLKPLGEDYLAVLQEGFENRWIDVYENRGKRTGAYQWGAYGTHPYVLLNYQDRLTDVFTLVHEMGHALHSWHSDHANPYVDAGYKIFVAEVASICNEALLIQALMERTKEEDKQRYLINYFLDQFKGTMFRQTMFAEFEKITHGMVEQGDMLTAEQICEIYLKLNQQYFGEEMISDPQIAYEWARIPHFYTPFYVYQYATGFAAAIAISSKILQGEEGIVAKYKQFLSAGGSMDPIDLLKLCDIDMASPQPVKEALQVFAAYLEKLENLV